jgi:hypothetical protein
MRDFQAVVSAVDSLGVLTIVLPKHRRLALAQRLSNGWRDTPTGRSVMPLQDIQSLKAS